MDAALEAFKGCAVYAKDNYSWVKYVLLANVPALLTKLLFPRIMIGQFKMLPEWFWPLCALFQIAFLLLLYFGKIYEGLILSYAFYGGVVASSTTLSFQPFNLIPTALCMISTAIWGLEAEIPPDVRHVYSLLAGFGIGHVLAMLRPEKKTGKKNV